MRGHTSVAATAALVFGLIRPVAATIPDDLCAPAADPCVVNTALTLTPGSVIDLGGRALQFGPAARVVVGAGDVLVKAGPVELQAGARITATTAVALTTFEMDSSDTIRLDALGSTRSRIDLSAAALAGSLTLNAQNGITVAGDLIADGTSSEGSGGNMTLLTTTGDVLISGSLSVQGGSDADGGTIFIQAPGKVDLSQVIDISGGDFGAGELDVTAGGDAIVRQNINASGGGLSGDGGTLSIDAGGSISLLGQFNGTASGDSDEGGGSGGDVELSADQDITVSGMIDLTGGFPDGEGGTFVVDSGGNFVQSQFVNLLGNGIDGCGGIVDVRAGRDATMNRLDASGGSCGAGEIGVQALGTVTLPVQIIADGTTGISAGGFILLQGRDVITNDLVRANGGSQSLGGVIAVQGCNVTVNQSSEIRALGQNGSNTIKGSGQITIRGKMTTAVGGTNTIVYRDPSMPPSITGTVSPAPVKTVDPTLPPCPGASAACGNGTPDPGEECDDGNTTSCDGCSASCRVEGCGNGRVECSEECDAGAQNGQPGSGCDATCKVIPLPGGLLLFPGGHTRNSCMAEWRIKLVNGLVSGGFPLTTQPCIDGDPGCDEDGATNGQCVFQTAVCAHVTDARIPDCDPIQVESISINKPGPLSATDPVDKANANALVNAIAALGLTVKAGTNVLIPGTPDTQHDHCTADVGINVPHPAGLSAVKTLNIAARDGFGARMRSNQVTLICSPNTAVCGNGHVEVGEQCDDGNTVACDGCAPTCRVERCGDGIVECGEACDDGPANGTPGSMCTATCTEIVPPLRIPGGGSKRSDCQLETAIDLQNVTLKGDGTPSNKQACVDNDPTCDFDPTPGSCRFHLFLCFGGADDRLACAADSVASIEVRKPSEKDQGPAAALRQALEQRIGALSLPLPLGEQCTQRVDVDVTAGKKQASLSLRTRDVAGIKDSDSIKLKCLPQAP
jgi:cysteine-rich repeat protein